MPKNPWEMTPEEMAAATKPKASAVKNPWEMSEAEMANAAKLTGPAPEPQPDITPDEFGQFIQTGKLPAGRKTVRELRSMPRGLIQNKEDLAAAYGVDPAKMSPYDLATAYDEFKAGESTGKSKGVLDTFWRAVKKGAVDPLRGVEQGIGGAFASAIPDSPGLQSSANLSDLLARIKGDQYARQNEANPITSMVGQGIGQAPYAALVPTAPIMGAASKAPGILRAAAGGAAFGFAQPITDPNQGRIGNTLIGAAMAPLAQTGVESGITALSKLRAALPGGKLPAQYESLQNEIRAAGMEPTAADLVSSPTSHIGKLRDVISNAPVGNFTAKNEANKIAAGQTIRNMVSGTRQNMLNQPISGLAELEAAAANGNDQAKLFLSRIQSQGASPGRNLQADISGQTFLRQNAANEAFEAAKPFAPSTPSDVSGINAAIAAQLAEAESMGQANRNAPLINYLTKLQSDITPEGVGSSYPALDRLLKGVKSKQASVLAPGSEITGNEASHALTQVKGAFKENLRGQEALPENQAFADAMAKARGIYREQVGPLKTPEVEGLMNQQPDLAAQSLSSKSPEEMRIIQSALGPRGRAASFHAIVDDIANEAATNRVSPEFQFQRGVFLDKLKAAKEALGEVATPLEKSQIDSIERVMQHMDQLDKTEFKAPNYTRWIWSQPNVILKPLLTTDWGKRMLLTLSASRVGSPAEKQVLQAIEQKIPQMLAMGQDHNGGNPVNDVPTE